MMQFFELYLEHYGHAHVVKDDDGDKAVAWLQQDLHPFGQGLWSCGNVMCVT